MLTIGHSTRTLEEFIGLLQAHAVSRVVDVRTVPRSRHNPQFNQDSFPDPLKKAGLGYVHMPGLGGMRHPKRDSPNMGWRNASFRGYAAGYFPIAAKPPLVLGEEAAGVVERGAAGFTAGERVIVYGGGLGVFQNGTWAELVAVPASSLRRLPEGVSFEEGAALSNVGVTAYGALRHGGLKAGETLVVLGATGGVGSAGAQIGRALRARVIAVVSKPERAAEIQQLGADHIVSPSEGSLAEQVQKLTDGKGADLVLDPIGGEITGQALAAVGTGGRLVHVGYSAGMSLTINSSTWSQRRLRSSASTFSFSQRIAPSRISMRWSRSPRNANTARSWTRPSPPRRSSRHLC